MTPSQTEEALDVLDNSWGAAVIAPTLDGAVPPPTTEEVVSHDAQASLLNDTAWENQQLTKQLKSMSGEVRRIRSQAAKARALGQIELQPLVWTARELRLAHSAVRRWKRLNTFRIAEQIMIGAVSVREANIIA